MNAETPDFAAARAAIVEALEQEPTAENYYWAGMIGYREAERENNNMYAGLAKDIPTVGAAMEESIEYFVKADELAQVPVLNKKGVEVPTDPKMRGKVSKMLLTYYKSDDLIRYGAQLYDANDFAGAFKAFKVHLSIPDLVLMQDEKLQKEMPRDTTYDNYKYNAACFAYRAEMHKEAAALFREMRDGEIEPLMVNQFLCQEYMTLQDTVSFVEALHHAILRFPQEDWFIQNLVSYSVQANKEQEAIDFFSQLIENNPSEPLYFVKRGVLYEMLEHFDEAMADFDKVLASNPNSADALAGKGRVYYNKAVKLNEAANAISDNKEYVKALDEMNAVFRESLPFFERAHELKPDNTNYLQTLKMLYYRFRSEPEMQAKYDEVEAKLNNL
jgi:tetratricopeptide (TPR) repeat protein